MNRPHSGALPAWPAPQAVNTSPVPTLLDTLAAELERPRPVTAQVITHLVGTCGLTRDAVGHFLETELPRLEDYEIDLILSPLFTPTLSDQAPFADLLGRNSVPPAEWPGLIQQLLARPTVAPLLTDDAAPHAVPLRAVTLERFVHRLRLEGTIPETLGPALARVSDPAARPTLQAIARRAIWADPARCDILQHYLSHAPATAPDPLADAVALLKLVETYQPASRRELLAQIPHWQRILRQELNPSAKPFFNERVEELHGGGRDQRRSDHTRLSAKESELALLDRLQRVLAD